MKNWQGKSVSDHKQKADSETDSVRLVGLSGGQTTGLSRYGRGLQQALTDIGVHTQVVGASGPPLPNIAVSAAKKLGFDLKTFFTTYPTQLSPGPQGVITHLTSQNQASAVAFRRPSRLIITVHDILTITKKDDPEITGHLKTYDKLFDRLMLRGLRHASAILADSEYTRQDVMRHTGYPAERIHVVYLGVDHAVFAPKPPTADFLARYHLHPETPYIVYVGSEDPRKNLRRLIDAFGRVVAHVPEARLLKVGAARFQEERQELLAYVERANLHGKVHFFDQVPDSDLAAFYNVARVFAFPSLAEGFGWPPLEAMACGTPVVASNATSLPEIIKDAALLVDPYDVTAIAEGIERALTDTGVRATLRQRGFERAAQFTWAQTARQTLAVYEQVRNQPIR